MNHPDVAAVFDEPGPFVSLYLDTNPEIENAGPQVALRWRNARDSLEQAKAPANALKAIDDVIDGAHRRGATLCAIATDAGLALVDHHDEPLHRDVARVAPLPSLAPLLEWRQAAIPHVMVVADRTGAELSAFRRRGATEAHHIEASPNEDVTKAQPGGWSQPRYQRRVENAWAANATEVADALTDLADKISARLVAVRGDVHAVELLTKALPGRVADLVKVVDHGDITEETVRLVSSAAAADTVQLLEKFREERGQSDRAADGAEATLAALSASQVETLLVHDDLEDDRTAWFGPDAIPVGRRADVLRDFGVEEPREERLVDVAIRAALGTGAGVWIVPRAGGPRDGLGAILRWA